MNLTQLIARTRVYARDNNSFMFKDSLIKSFLEEAVDRIAQYKVFENMSYLTNVNDEPSYLPKPYHYLLALYASARCYDTDERFFEGTEKRNEFEYYFDNLIADIESGNVVIKDKDGKEVINDTALTSGCSSPSPEEEALKQKRKDFAELIYNRFKEGKIKYVLSSDGDKQKIIQVFKDSFLYWKGCFQKYAYFNELPEKLLNETLFVGEENSVEIET